MSDESLLLNAIERVANAHPERVNRKAFYVATCAHCGQEFQSYGNKGRKYCSRLCFNQARRKGEQG